MKFGSTGTTSPNGVEVSGVYFTVIELKYRF